MRTLFFNTPIPLLGTKVPETLVKKIDTYFVSVYTHCKILEAAMFPDINK